MAAFVDIPPTLIAIRSNNHWYDLCHQLNLLENIIAQKGFINYLFLIEDNIYQYIVHEIYHIYLTC